VAGQIARYKKPKHVVFVAQFAEERKQKGEKSTGPRSKAAHGEE